MTLPVISAVLAALLAPELNAAEIPLSDRKSGYEFMGAETRASVPAILRVAAPDRADARAKPCYFASFRFQS